MKKINLKKFVKENKLRSTQAYMGKWYIVFPVSDIFEEGKKPHSSQTIIKFKNRLYLIKASERENWRIPNLSFKFAGGKQSEQSDKRCKFGLHHSDKIHLLSKTEEFFAKLNDGDFDETNTA
jgi:hypothetical protein